MLVLAGFGRRMDAGAFVPVAAHHATRRQHRTALAAVDSAIALAPPQLADHLAARAAAMAQVATPHRPARHSTMARSGGTWKNFRSDR